MHEPRFIVSDAPAQAQSIDVEEWKEKRNEEMAKALVIIALYKEGDKHINVNECDADEYLEKGWSRTPVADKPKPTVSKPIPSVTNPSSITSNTK